MTINSEKSSDCGRSILSFRPVSRRTFGIESKVENASGEETWRTQLLRIIAPAPVPRLAAGFVTIDLAVAVFSARY